MAKIDAEDDETFYEPPRLVLHIDESAVAALTQFYRAVLPPGGVLLDLMSSWVSHLPPEIDYAEVVGHGMNAAELAANPRLARRFVQNLNRDPMLAFADSSFDAAMICVSIQYLTDPIAVLSDLRRVVRPGGLTVVTFSNRCFPTKAVAVWLGTTDQQHVDLVRAYFERAAGWSDVTGEDRSPGDGGDPLYAVWARASRTRSPSVGC